MKLVAETRPEYDPLKAFFVEMHNLLRFGDHLNSVVPGHFEAIWKMDRNLMGGNSTLTFPIQVGRPNSAQNDWLFCIVCGFAMIGISLYLIHPFEATGVFFVSPFLIAIFLFVLVSMFRYTYGEIVEDGLRYRRLWGWQNASWNEIDTVDIDSRNAIVIRLNHGNRWQSRLRFPEIYSETDQQRQEVVSLCRSRLAKPHV